MDGQAGPGQGQLLTTLAILQCDGKPTIALAAASRSFRPHPLLQLLGAERRRRAFPAAIPLARPSLRCPEWRQREMRAVESLRGCI